MDLTDEQWTVLEPLIGELRRRADGTSGAHHCLGEDGPQRAEDCPPRPAERGTRPTVDRALQRRRVGGVGRRARSGRPRTYPEDAYSRVIAKARALPPKPAEGEVPPTCHRTLDRLQAELAKEGHPIKRSRIRRLLKAEHIKWQKPRTRLNLIEGFWKILSQLALAGRGCTSSEAVDLTMQAGSAIGTGSRRPSSGVARPSRGVNSSARTSIKFEERRT